MTENLSETIRRQFLEYRRTYAQMVHDLLRIAEISNDLHYNDLHMIIVEDVQIFFATDGVEITFDDVHGQDGDTQFVKLAAPYTPIAVSTVVQGLLKMLNNIPSRQASLSGSDDPRCCGKPMHEHRPTVWDVPDRGIDVERVLHCLYCDGYTHVQVTDREEANCLASEVTRP